MTLYYHIMEIEQVASNDPHIMYIEIHVHIHIHIHIRVHVHIHIHIFVYTCTYIHIYLYTHKLGVGDNGGDKTRVLQRVAVIMEAIRHGALNGLLQTIHTLSI